VSHNHDDIAARLRDEASATAPERLQADVMLRVRAEPRPQRIRPRRRSFGRSFATVAAAACILGAMVLGLSRVDLGGNGSAASGGGSAAQFDRAAPSQAPGGTLPVPAPATSPQRGLGYKAARPGATSGLHDQLSANAVPLPLRAAILGRFNLALPIRHAFGAIDPHHGRSRR
jgi:hypothetical protein